MAERPERRKVRRHDVRLIQMVAVLLAFRRQPGVEGLLRACSTHEAHGVRQARIDRSHKVLRRNRLGEAEMHDEASRVDSGVRSRRTVNTDGRALKALEHFFHYLLHAQRVGLTLPTGIGTSVVFYRRLVFHEFSRSALLPLVF